jgi:hypothetical protein
MGAKTGIAAPRMHLAGGGIANAENIGANMFQPIGANSAIPNADVSFITSPQLSVGQGPPKEQSPQPQKQSSGIQDIAQTGAAANSLVNAGSGLSDAAKSAYGGIGQFFSGANPSLAGSIQSGLAGNGYGGVLSGANAQSADPFMSTNSFAPGMSLDTLGSSSAAADAALPAAAETAAAATTDAAAADGGAEALETLFMLAAKGGAITERADGGEVNDLTNSLMRREAGETYHPGGLLNSAGPGRTDTINTNVPTGAYVIPADVVSGLGEGNTLAGSAVIDRMFSSQPHGVKAPNIREGRGVKIPNPPSSEPRQPPTGVQSGPTVNTAAINSAGTYAKGGKTDDGKAPVVVAGGEHVLSPQQIINKFGSLKRGHKILDHWVVLQRQKIAKEMLSLAHPVGSKVKI